MPIHTFGRHKGYKNTDALGGYHYHRIYIYIYTCMRILCLYDGLVCVVRGQVVGGDRGRCGVGIYGEKYLRPG